METKTKDFVTLRSRKRASGLEALYLDISFGGVRKNEYLKLYLTGGKTREDRAKDKETLRKAEIMRSQRVLDLQEQRLGRHFLSPDKVLFWPYFDKIMSTKGVGTKRIWRFVKSHLLQFSPDEGLRLSDITKRWVREFCRHLDTVDVSNRLPGKESDERKLKESTKAIYLSKFKEVLDCAVKDEIIPYNPAKGFRYSTTSREKEFLTVPELRKLSETKVRHPVIKRMFLFSCLTGMRWSDITNLKWGNIHTEGSRTWVQFTQQKTHGNLSIDLDAQAISLLGERTSAEKSIFDFSMAIPTLNYHLTKWVAAAGIKKHVTFHCARHTFATIMLSRGVDIYTVSKLLGHSSIDTTQIYLRLIDDSRVKAMQKVPKIMDLSSSGETSIGTLQQQTDKAARNTTAENAPTPTAPSPLSSLPPSP